MNLSIVIAPFEPESTSSMAVGPRQFDEVDHFATELGRAAGITVAIVEGHLTTAPPDGLIVAFDRLGFVDHPEIGPRVVLINADRSTIVKDVMQFSLAAAVEKQMYFLWRTQRRGSVILGRKDVAAQFGGDVRPGPFQSEQYG